MAKLGKAATRQRNQQLLWIVLGSCAIVAIVSYFVYSAATREQGVDAKTLCPAAGPKGHYVLLVDKTDPLTFTQKQAFNVTLRDLIERRLPTGYLFSVFVLGEDYQAAAEPLIELCNPGTGADKSELSANLGKLRRQYETKFLTPLLKKSEDLVAIQPGKGSPIFEMLQLVAINGFKRHDVKGERRLIVMSDMLHHSADFSMYQGLIDYDSFAQTGYGRKVQLQLPGVDIELHYLINTPKLQTKRNMKFWEDHFSRANARLVEVRPLEG